MANCSANYNKGGWGALSPSTPTPNQVDVPNANGGCRRRLRSSTCRRHAACYSHPCCPSALPSPRTPTPPPAPHPPPPPPPAVFLYNNLLLNPAPYRTQWSHLSIAGARTYMLPTIPANARGDTNLQLKGNVVWNAPAAADIALGIYHPSDAPNAGCPPSNPTCNATLLRANNKFNTLQPALVAPASGNFRPVAGGNLYGAGMAAAIPSFPAWAVAAPAPPLANSVLRDKAGALRLAGDPPGAFRG